MKDQNNSSLLDETDDEIDVDSRFATNDEIIDMAQDDNERFYPKMIEILSDQFDDSEISIDLDDGDTFEITREDDPMYDLYPPEAKRPKDLFKQPIYDRQLGESQNEYQRFLVFASLPPAKRTVLRAWREWNAQNEGSLTTKPSNQFRNISSHWRWGERAYVLDLQKVKLSQQIWIERDIERREQDWQVGDELRQKAFAALDTLNADELGPSSIAKFFALASDLQKESVPETGLNSDDLGNILNNLPKDRRDRVIEIVVAKAKIS